MSRKTNYSYTSAQTSLNLPDTASSQEIVSALSEEVTGKPKEQSPLKAAVKRTTALLRNRLEEIEEQRNTS